MNNERIIVEKELLFGLYWGNGYSSYKLADMFECSTWTILDRMRKYNIPRKDFNCEEYRRDRKAWNKGLTKEMDDRVAKISKALTGKSGHPAWNKYLTRDEFLKHFKDGRIWNEGLTVADDNRIYGGERHWNWKGGISEKNHGFRLANNGKEHKWRKAVFERDNYICQECDEKGENGVGYTVILNAHHIKYYAEYPDSRFDVDNGITLCYNCHRELHKSKR